MTTEKKKHNFAHTADKTIKDAPKSRIMMSDAHRQEVYKEAINNQMYPLGDEYRDANGLYADWAPFDFILSNVLFPEGTTMMRVLRGFWAENWKYLSRALKCYKAVSEDFIRTMEEMDAVVARHADQGLELKIYQEYFAEHGEPEGLKKFRDEVKKTHEEQIRKVVHGDRERRATQQEAKYAERKKEEKMDAESKGPSIF